MISIARTAMSAHVVFAILCLAGPTFAQDRDAEIRILRDENDRMREQLREQDERLDALEKRPAATQTAASDSDGDAAEGEVVFVGDPDLPWLDNRYYKVHIQIRARIELAKIDGFESSQAYTIRTHAGIGLKPWQG